MDLFRKEALDHAARRLTGEVILVSPLSLRILALLGCAVAVCIVLFGSLVRFSEKETAVGWLVPKGGIVRMTTRTGGVITDIFVKEGDEVRIGEPIARVRLTSSLQSGEDISAATNQALAIEARENRSQASAQVAKLTAEKDDLSSKLQGLNGQLGEVDKQIVIQQGQVGIALEDMNRYEKLYEGGNISAREVSEKRSALLTSQQTLSELRVSKINSQQQVLDILARLHAIPDEIAVANANADATNEQIREKSIQANMQNADIITASLEGRVLSILFDRGQSVGAGAVVAVVAPSQNALEAEIFAPSKAIGSVNVGNQVRLMYDAFPFERFGAAKGTVTSVSHTVLAPVEIAIPGAVVAEPSFRVLVKLDRQSVTEGNQTVPLQPGMLLKADVVVAQRTLLSWIFDPLSASSARR